MIVAADVVKKGARSRSHTNTTGTGKTAALASVVNAGLPVCQVHLTRVCPAKKVILDAAIEMNSEHNRVVYAKEPNSKT